ncbi:AraC family transcriptional regulator [Actinomycetospora chiangmaiensis]|uniref:AraC family transcriptional regulator n=1 Tax=Actinomycetospora chiangmaiensis TaxID=402650 RepID=UPI000382883D|nr:helix-turn-helix transcriptional regulator [Actinomycetospora chiangmaiensis]
MLRSHFATNDFDEARAVLAAAYGEHDAVLRGEQDRFYYAATAVEVDGLRMDQIDYRSRVESRCCPPEDRFVVGQLRDGVLTQDRGAHQRVLGPGGLVWFEPGRPQQLLSEDVSFDLVRLDADVLGRVAAEMAGVDPARLRFHPRAPVSAARTRYWSATYRWIAEHVFGREEVAVEPLIRTEALRTVARATLLAVPNTALDALADRIQPAARRAEPAALRRALEFMDAHAHEDVDITRITAAAGIGVRGLQAAFQRHRGQTPLEYLRRVRLESAHRDLQAGDPTRGATVRGIAARWGFAHPGRFSVLYRRTYRCSPNDTLRR